MKKMIWIPALVLALCLGGCGIFGDIFINGEDLVADYYESSAQADAEESAYQESARESSDSSQHSSESQREILPDPDDREDDRSEEQRDGFGEPDYGDEPATVSLMAQLPADATTEDMVRAFEKDYTRAARVLGVNAAYSNLDYEENDDTAMVTLDNGMMIYLDPPSTYHRVWYVGYFDSDEWILREAQLALMACEPTIPADVAAKYVDDLFVEAWNNRDNMPSAIIDRDTWDGLACSVSLNDRGLVSYWIVFESPAAQGYEQI